MVSIRRHRRRWHPETTCRCIAIVFVVTVMAVTTMDLIHLTSQRMLRIDTTMHDSLRLEWNVPVPARRPSKTADRIHDNQNSAGVPIARETVAVSKKTTKPLHEINLEKSEGTTADNGKTKITIGNDKQSPSIAASYRGAIAATALLHNDSEKQKKKTEPGTVENALSPITVIEKPLKKDKVADEEMDMVNKKKTPISEKSIVRRGKLAAKTTETQQNHFQGHHQENQESMGIMATKVTHSGRNTSATRDMYLSLTAPNLWDGSDLLPNWLKDYFAWHQRQVALLNESNWHNFQFLIPVAKTGVRSGGMTDRLRPIPALLRLAAQTKRILMIHWSRPFALEEFLLPPQGGVDWRVPSYMLQDVLTTPVCTDWDLLEAAAHKDGNTLVTAKYQSWNYGELWYDENRLEGEPRAQKAFRDIWRIAFTPSHPVAHRIQTNFERLQLVPGEFATVHIRALYGKKDRAPREIEWLAHNGLNCTSNLRPGGPFFVASDSVLAVKYAIEYGQAHNVTVVAANHPKQPMHVDFHNESDTSITPSDFYDGFVDLYLMGATRCAAIGKGGFARWGQLLGYNDTCLIHHVGPKSQFCNWTDTIADGQGMPGYPSEVERLVMQKEASNGIPKYHTPML